MNPLATLTPEEEIARLKTRVNKLAEEKSYQQLVLRLIERLNPLPGLDDMVRGLLFSIVETIGGTNIKLYYWIEAELHYVDFLGEEKILAEIDDPVIAQVAASQEFVEHASEASDALLRGGVIPGAWTWTFPLLVGKELIGIIKLENINIIGTSLRTYLPIFFSHVALILSNEVRTHARHKIEAALREKTEELDSYFNSALDLFCIADTQGYFRKLNPAWQQTLGYSLADLQGQRFLDFIHPDDVAATLEVMATLSEQRPVIDFINRYRHRDGSYRWIEWHSTPRGELIYAAARDITEHHELEAERQQYQERLEQQVQQRTAELSQAKNTAESANRMKSVFLANMSHELRTPLNAILGFAQIMARDTRIPEDGRFNLATINRSGRHLLSLINDVLEISRIEAGRLRIQLQSCDLHELLHSVSEIIELRAHDKGLALATNISPSLPRYVSTDPGKLRQILINLLTNAVKYTQQGQITLAAAAEVSGQLAALDLTVSDTGIGIAAKELQAIFEPFYQTDHGIALGEGTGLGLAISRSYAKLLGGELSVESVPEQGSTFRLRLGVSLAQAGELQALHRGRVLGLAPGQRSFRILIVEDDADSRRLLEAILLQAEFEVRAAENGQQAVELFEQWHPDFIWLDMRMPVLNGYQAARQIRALPGGDTVKIAALTASVFIESREEILASGCDAVLAKPLEEDKLFEIMGRLLGLNYRYADQAPAPEPVSDAALDLCVLPADLRGQLHDAAQLLDMETTSSIIARIRLSHPDLADGLAALEKNYRFDQIVDLCKDI